MSVHIVKGMALERTGPILLARILGYGGYPITQASVSTIKYEVGYRDTPAEKRTPLEELPSFPPVRTSDAAKSLNVADVIFDTLQRGATWVVTAAAPATAENTTLYVDPLPGNLPNGTTLSFPTGAAILTARAVAGARSLPATITGTITAGQRAIAGRSQAPAQSPWKVDDKGYNFAVALPASDLPAIPISQYPLPRYYVVSVELTPTVGDAIGWEYEIETYHRLYNKWQAAS